MSKLADSIVQIVAQVLGPQDRLVLLHAPVLPSNASKYVQECIDTGWVSSAGEFVTQFEENLARFTGASRAVATVNGTAALEMCLRLVGVQLGDEVIVPSLTFVATANAITHCGAVPHFVDVNSRTLGVCPETLANHLKNIAAQGADGTVRNRQTGNRIAAVCPIHTLGHPCEIADIFEICQHYGIELVEDAAESLGSFHKGRHTGRFGRVSVVSFNGNKIITTGGGGAILTDDEELANRAKHLTTTAKVPHPWEFHHDEIAWNYRMPNINAALGVAQLEILPEILERKRKLASAYNNAFLSLDSVEFIVEPLESSSNYWLNALRVKNSTMETRNEILQYLNQAGFQSRPIWEPMHRLPMFEKASKGDLRQTESIRKEIINIPSSAFLAK